MRIAITEFESTVSPLFDVARRLLVADVENGEATNVHEQIVTATDCASRIAALRDLGVQVVVCGAISGFIHHALVDRGIRVYPWVSGEVHDVLDLLAARYKPLKDGKATKPDNLAVSAKAPDIDAAVEHRFRHCRYFLIVGAEDSVVQIVENPQSRSRYCEGVTLARSLLGAGARVLLTGQCGPNTLGVLCAAGVDVVLGVEGTVRNAVKCFRRGEFVPSAFQDPHGVRKTYGFNSRSTPCTYVLSGEARVMVKR